MLTDRIEDLDQALRGQDSPGQDSPDQGPPDAAIRMAPLPESSPG
jgi:hypothetical protein